MWPNFRARVRYPDFSWFGWSFSYLSERYDDDPLTKVVQLVETVKIMCNKSHFGQLFWFFYFFGPRFSLRTVNLLSMNFHFSELFWCIFRFCIDWERWFFVTYREIFQDGLKTERKSYFSRFWTLSVSVFEFQPSSLCASCSARQDASNGYCFVVQIGSLKIRLKTGGSP